MSRLLIFSVFKYTNIQHKKVLTLSKISKTSSPSMQWLCNTTLLLLCKVKNRGITLIAPAQSYTSWNVAFFLNFREILWSLNRRTIVVPALGSGVTLFLLSFLIHTDKKNIQWIKFIFVNFFSSDTVHVHIFYNTPCFQRCHGHHSISLLGGLLHIQ